MPRKVKVSKKFSISIIYLSIINFVIRCLLFSLFEMAKLVFVKITFFVSLHTSVIVRTCHNELGTPFI